MSDLSTEALLAHCCKMAALERAINADEEEAARWSALAAIVRAQQTLRAEVEKLKQPRSIHSDGWQYADGYNRALADVLRLVPAHEEK